jgi:hypothetical protein
VIQSTIKASSKSSQGSHTVSPIVTSFFSPYYMQIHQTAFFQPWTSHGLHGSWVGRRRESLRIHGQPMSADVGDSHYFLGSADVGQKRRKVYTISCVLKVRRCTQCLGNKLQHFYICDFKSGHQIISLSI